MPDYIKQENEWTKNPLTVAPAKKAKLKNKAQASFTM